MVERKERIRLAEKIARQHPDWGYRKVNQELRRRTGQGLDDHLVRQIKKRVVGLKKRPMPPTPAYTRHDRIRMAEALFRQHPDWGYRRVNRAE